MPPYDPAECPEAELPPDPDADPEEEEVRDPNAPEGALSLGLYL